MPDVNRIIKRYDRLMSDQSGYFSTLQELADYILPRKRGITTTITKGAKLMEKVYDSTAIHANELLAASMAGSLTNQSSKWKSLRIRGEDDIGNREANLWLDDCSNRLLKALTQSNFYSQANEVWTEIGALGTSALLVEEKRRAYPGFNGFQFTCLAMGSYAIAEGEDGRVNTIFRKFEWTAQQAIEKWGEKAGARVVKAFHENKPDDTFEFIHGIYPRTSGDTSGWSAATMPFESVYVSLSDKHLISVGGFPEFPVMVPRWSKIAGEPFGRGCGHTALPDVRTLNKAKQMELEALALVIRPPLITRSGGVLDAVRWVPGGSTVVKGPVQDAFMAAQLGTRFDITQIKEEELREHIKEVFFSSQLQFPPVKQGNPMTASEVLIRYEIMQRLLGPTFGQLIFEFLSPCTEREFAIMMRAGAFLPPPPSVIDIARRRGGDIDIEYEGPLSRAQRTGDLDALNKFFTFLGPVVQIDPEQLDNVDLDEAVRVGAIATQVPPKVMRGRNQVAAMRQARRVEEAEAKEQEQIAAMAETANKLSPAAKVLSEMGAQAKA